MLKDIGQKFPDQGNFLRIGRLFGRSAGMRRPFSVRKILRTIVLTALDFAVITLTLLGLAASGRWPELSPLLAHFAPIAFFGAVASAILYLGGLYRRSWRFFGFWHALYLVFIFSCALSASWLSSYFLFGLAGNGIALTQLAVDHWLISSALALALRATRRAMRENHAAGTAARIARRADNSARRALLVGSPQWTMSVIELLRAEKEPAFVPVGILLPSVSDTIDRIGGVRVLGTHDMLTEVVEELDARGRRPSLVIACDDGTHLSHREMARLTHRARALGLELSRIRDAWSHLLQRPGAGEPGEVSIKDLLGRNEYELDGKMISKQVAGKCVLVTGAGGTIGSELCRQLASFKPSRLVLLEHSEYQLYNVENRLREQFPEVDIRPALCNIREREAVRQVFARHKPVIVYHAAALKHVPIVEDNPCAGVHTNVVGTRIVADAVCEFGAKAMVQVSTDKAVNPVGLMGATKRVGELYAQALDMCGCDDEDAPRFMTVRFGNVLGSSGSIVPLFLRQLSEGKPLTVTHPDIERFFMTVHEAVQLILQSSSSALQEGSPRGSIFVLDMGKPVRIVDLAYRMIGLYGLEPETDVPIEFVGLRPGEKLYEELFDNCEQQVECGIKGVFEARSQPIPLPFITKSIDRLAQAVARGDEEEARAITHNLVKIPSSGAKLEMFSSHVRKHLQNNVEQLNL